MDPETGRARPADAAGGCSSPDELPCLGVVSKSVAPSGNSFADLDDGLPDRTPAPGTNLMPVTVPPAHAAGTASDRPGNADAYAALCRFTQGVLPALVY